MRVHYPCHRGVFREQKIMTRIDHLGICAYSYFSAAAEQGDGRKIAPSLLARKGHRSLKEILEGQLMRGFLHWLLSEGRFSMNVSWRVDL